MAVTALAIAALFLFAAAPGVHWLDAGEFGASIFLLGIAHPTGFSLLHVIGKGATLLPIGSIAFRLNLLAGVCVTAAAMLLLATFRLALTTTGTHEPDADDATQSGLQALASLAGVATFCGALNVAMHGAVIEIYSLNLVLIGALLYCFTRWRAQADTRWLYAAALAAGMGLGTHATALMAAGVVAIALFVPRSATPRPAAGNIRRVAIGGILFAVIGALVVLYLPFASARQPFHQWVPAHEWRGFVSEITARTIRQAFQSEIGSWNATVFFGIYDAIA